jgi:lysophospholipase L1-like esterase
MQFTQQQLHAYALGIVSSSTLDAGWHAMRIPSGLQEIYDRSDAFRIRMHCPAGVRIRFSSNTKFLGISLRFAERARQVFKSVLIVDSKEAIPFGPDEFAANWSGGIFHQSTSENRTFDIWLPHMAQTDVLTLETEPGAAIHSAPPLKFRWLAYGDSITQGMTATLPHETAIARTALALNANVLNVGIGGAKLDDELSQKLPPEHFDIVSIAYGTNDFGHMPAADFAARARALVKALLQKQPGQPIILITPLTWVGNTTPNKFGATLADFRTSLHPIADEFKEVTLLHGDKLIPDDDKYFVDKVHPNSDGFALYANLLTTTIKSVLKL